MQELYKLLNEILDLLIIRKGKELESINYTTIFKSIDMNDGLPIALCVSSLNIRKYNNVVNQFYKSNKSLLDKFSQKTQYNYISDKIWDAKVKNKSFTQEESNNFFLNLKNIKVPLNNTIITKNSLGLSQIWIIYKKKHENTKLSDIEERILSTALAIGESFRTEETKNALIYSCIALESLFSFKGKELFQDSIGEKIANGLTFIVGKNKEERSDIIQLTKEVYAARSILVHGSKLETEPRYMDLNFLIRQAISNLLTQDKFRKVTRIEDLYTMVKEAQISY